MSGELGRGIKDLANAYARVSGWRTSPWLAALTHGAAGAGLGYLSGAGVGRLFGRYAPPGSPEARRLKRRVAVLGALAGAAPGALVGLSNFGTKAAGELSDWPGAVVPINRSRVQVLSDPHLGVAEKAQLVQVIDRAADGRSKGLTLTQRVIGAGIEAGLGAFGAALFGKTLALPDSLSHRAIQAGALAGAIHGAGII